MATPLRPFRSGALFAVAAPLLYGASIPFNKLLLAGADPWMLCGLLQLGAGAGLGVLMMIRSRYGRPEAEKNFLRRADWPWFGGSILMGGVLGSVLLLLGIGITPAATAALLLNLEGIFTALIAWFVFKERFSWRSASGLGIIALGGAVLCSWGAGVQPAFYWGAAAIVGACFGWAVSSNLTQKISGRDPVQISTLRALLAGSANVLFALALGNRFPALPTVAAAAALGFLSDGIAVLCYVIALHKLGAARTGTYFSLAPFVGAFVAVLLGETPTLSLLLAAALMFLGLWICLSERYQSVSQTSLIP